LLVETMSQVLGSFSRQLLRNSNKTKSFSPFVQTRAASWNAEPKLQSTKPKVSPSLLNIPPTKASALKNGMIVATEEHAHALNATVGVWVNTGSGFENDRNNGVAHFLEHLAFKGTTSRTRNQLELEVENMGAHLNAYTSREQTVYFSKCFKDHVGPSIDILADILQNATFSEQSIESERSVILREMEEIENNPEEVVFDYLHAAAFQGTPLARTILGPANNIKRINRKDLQDYVATHYTGPRMVLAAAGAVKHEEIVKMAEKAFTSIGSGDNVRDSVKGEYTGSEVRIRKDDMPLAHIAIAVEGMGWTHPDYFVMGLIQILMGCWDRNVGGVSNLSSRLAELVATNKLAHQLTTFNTCYAETGLVGNYAVVPPDRIDDLIGEITDEWQRIANSITPAEVERAKHKYKASLLMGYENNTFVAEEIGRQMLAIGRRIPLAEVSLRVDDITASDVRRVAAKHFTDVSPCVVGYGPIDDLPDYNVMRGWTYWNRL